MYRIQLRLFSREVQLNRFLPGNGLSTGREAVFLKCSIRTKVRFWRKRVSDLVDYFRLMRGEQLGRSTGGASSGALKLQAVGVGYVERRAGVTRNIADRLGTARHGQFSTTQLATLSLTRAFTARGHRKSTTPAVHPTACTPLPPAHPIPKQIRLYNS